MSKTLATDLHRSNDVIFPASLIQLQFWIITMQYPRSPTCHMPSVCRIDGSLNVEALSEAFNVVLKRHAIFRTTLEICEGKLVQRVSPWRHQSLPQVDLRKTPALAEVLSVPEEMLAEEVRRPFDLSSDWPLRVRLFRTGERSHVFTIVAHHVAFDLVTQDLFAEELSREYSHVLRSEPETMDEERPSYADYCAWELSWLGREDYRTAIKNWQRYLEGAGTVLQLPADRVRPVEATLAGTVFPISIGVERMERVRRLCRGEVVTPYLVFLAAWVLTLCRWSGQDKFCVGTPLTNRRNEAFRRTMGCFVNILPLRIDLSGCVTLRDVLKKVRLGMLELHRMQEMPYSQLVTFVRKTVLPGVNPLFQVGFTFAHPMELHLEGLQVEARFIHAGDAQLDLFASFWEEGDKASGVLEYSSELFERGTVGRIAEIMEFALDGLSFHPEHSIETFLRSIPDSTIPTGRRPAGLATARPAREAGVIVDTRGASAKDSSIVVSATFTAEAVQSFLEFWFGQLGWRVGLSYAPFNQVFQGLLDPASLLRSNRQGYNVLLVRLQDLLVGAADGMDDGPTAAAADWLPAVLGELRQAIAAAAPSMSVPLCVVLCPSSPLWEQTLRGAGDVVGDLLASLRSLPGVVVLTHEDVTRCYPVADYYEPLGETIGSIPYTREYLAALATTVVRSLAGLSRAPVKALVVDCDGTLWDGVAAEDGPTGVSVGPDQRRFQDFLLAQHRAGVILALCSKNREEDAWAVFNRHPEMLLRREHIAFWKINWEPKSVNLPALAAEMNIGLDAVAFLDDNPVERSEVRARCPAVYCPEMPAAWPERAAWLEHLWVLDRPQVTEDDRKRQDHYRSERLREELKRGVGSLGDFLEKLELHVDINLADASNFDRLAQLSARTNQFNTTTLRLTPQKVAAYSGAPGQAAHVAHVRDRFGDYGLVGGILTREAGGVLCVEGMLLSCRALGRGVEHRMAAYLGDHARRSGCATVEFFCRTTERNEPARKFLAQLAKSCQGDMNDNDTLLVDAARLAGARYQPPEDAAPPPAVRETKETASLEVSLQRELVTRVAEEYRAVEKILDAVDKKKRADRVGAGVPVVAQAPETSTERLIADAWKRALGLEQVDTFASFFELGGTSLLLAMVAIELQRDHGLKVSIVDLFHFPTIAGLARHLDADGAGGDRSEPAACQAQLQRDWRGGHELPASFLRLKQARGK